MELTDISGSPFDPQIKSAKLKMVMKPWYGVIILPNTKNNCWIIDNKKIYSSCATYHIDCEWWCKGSLIRVCNVCSSTNKFQNTAGSIIILCSNFQDNYHEWLWCSTGYGIFGGQLLQNPDFLCSNNSYFPLFSGFFILCHLITEVKLNFIPSNHGNV